MNDIPGYDAWKLSGPEGPYPCDHCNEVFHEDDLQLFESGQFCCDCTPCATCGENVGEAQLDDDHHLCDDCYADAGEAQDERRAELFHGGSEPFTVEEKYRAAAQLDRDLKAGRR